MDSHGYLASERGVMFIGKGPLDGSEGAILSALAAIVAAATMNSRLPRMLDVLEVPNARC